MTAADAACMWIGRVFSGLWIVTIGAIILAAVDGRVRDWRETRRNRRRDVAYTRVRADQLAVLDLALWELEADWSVDQ